MTDTTGPSAEIRAELRDRGILSGSPHGEELFALVVYSTASTEDLLDALEAIRADVGDAPAHLRTTLYTTDEERAVASLWTDPEDVRRVSDALADLEGRAHGAGSGFATMGMFYRTRAGERATFVDRFSDVVDLLEGMDGHVDTELFSNVEDGDDMFVRSRWEDREAAMAFFRSDAFRETVEWGREVLAERPRHVFLV